MRTMPIPAYHRSIDSGLLRRFMAFAFQGLLLFSLVALPACSRVISMAASDLADNLSHAVANNDDPQTVREGAAAYLLMLDGMIHSDPENESLLTKASALYSTYSAAFVHDPERAKKLSTRALDYATRAVCVRYPDDCGLRQAEFEVFEARIQRIDREDVPVFFTLGSAWAGWIQAHKADLEAVAELSRVEAIMQRIVVVDETYRQGSAHLYLGTFAILVPPALGGQPEVARDHFERAITLSKGENLMAKVVYAQQYARVVYDRDLHDRLLTEVLAAVSISGAWTFIFAAVLLGLNTLAQDRARALMASADDYF